MYKAIVFDLDDTLYPERAYTFSGFAAVAEAFEDRLGDRVAALADMQRLFDSPSRSRVFNALLIERGIGEDEKLIDAMIACYRGHRPTIELYPDADAALSRLRSSLVGESPLERKQSLVRESLLARETYKLGLISDGRAVQQWAKIDALRLRPRLDEIIITSELGEGFSKPQPAAFEQMARRLGVEHASCVYVADNPAKDFIAPNALGWLTVQIARSDGLYRHELGIGTGRARVTIEDLSDLGVPGAYQSSSD